MAVYAIDVELCELVDPLDGKAYGTEGDAEYTKFVNEKVWPFFFANTQVGRDMKASIAMTDELRDCFSKEFARRFGVRNAVKGGIQYPGCLLVTRIESVIADLLVTKNPALTPLEDVEQPTIVEPTDAEKFAALVAQCHEDMANPAISTVEINKKKQNLEYRKAFERATLEGRAAFMGKSLEPEVKEEAPAKIKQFAHLLNAEIQARGTPKMNAGFVTLRANGTDYRYPVAEFQSLTEEAVKYGLIL